MNEPAKKWVEALRSGKSHFLPGDTQCSRANMNYTMRLAIRGQGSCVVDAMTQQNGAKMMNFALAMMGPFVQNAMRHK